MAMRKGGNADWEVARQLCFHVQLSHSWAWHRNSWIFALGTANLSHIGMGKPPSSSCEPWPQTWRWFSFQVLYTPLKNNLSASWMSPLQSETIKSDTFQPLPNPFLSKWICHDRGAWNIIKPNKIMICENFTMYYYLVIIMLNPKVRLNTSLFSLANKVMPQFNAMHNAFMKKMSDNSQRSVIHRCELPQNIPSCA